MARRGAALDWKAESNHYGTRVDPGAFGAGEDRGQLGRLGGFNRRGRGTRPARAAGVVIVFGCGHALSVGESLTER